MSSENNKIIEILVSPTGATTVQTKGFSGDACRDASRFIERALGESTGDVLTAEFHQPQLSAEQVRQT